MATNMKDFVEEFIEVQNGIMRDYPDSRGVCHMMHQDIGLGQTKREDADEQAERVAEMIDDPEIEVDGDSLDFTVEHKELHEFLRQLMMEATIAGASPDQLMATMFIVGRRMGMREAADMLSPSDLPSTSQEGREADLGDMDD